MTIQIEQIRAWLSATSETEILEFKEAKQSYRKGNVARYTTAIANEGGGWLVLGITDKPPRSVVGSSAYRTSRERNDLKVYVFDKIGVDIRPIEAEHGGQRILAISIPARPAGKTIDFEGQRLMRRGESLVAMTDERLKEILNEGEPDWSLLTAADGCSDADVVHLLDTATYFELLKSPYPTTQAAVVARLKKDGLIRHEHDGWTITNLAAIAIAKRLVEFSADLAAKAPRFITYSGNDRRTTKNELDGAKGFAVGFAGLVSAVHEAAPHNQYDEELIRNERKTFPLNALRELIANALVHQDFGFSGLSARIELFDDRIEIMSPGSPIVSTDRFVDEDRARNERLSELFRRLGLCERKGSGIDKVIFEVEYHQLPALDIRGSDSRTSVVLFAHKPFTEMDRDERMRACYQHCCLRWVNNKKTSNRSLRERFGLGDSSSSQSQVSQVLAAAREKKLIRPDDSGGRSPRYSRYMPWWA